MAHDAQTPLGHPKRSTRWMGLVVFFIFVLAAGLRIALAWVNREAHDNHMEVIQLMLQEQRLVERADCWECFQPKLYYALVVSIIRAAGIYPGFVTPGMIITAQMLNALLGIIILVIAWAFLSSIPVQNQLLKVSAFALLAFNPKMIGINGEALNDTLAILLAMLSMYAALRFLQKGQPAYIIACGVFMTLGLATKTNLLIMVAAITLAFSIKTYMERQKFMAVSLLIFLLSIIILSAINPLTQYQVNYQKYGAIATMNRGIARHAFPYLFEKTYIERSGITSITDGFFTFKYFDLLEYPRMTNGMRNYPAHRTSLWTYLYAYAHSVYFDNCPPTWSFSGTEYFTLTRFIFIFALLPSFMILIGAVSGTGKFLTALFKRSPAMLEATNYGLYEIAFWGYIAFLILYAMMYRDYSVMKTIYIYPALLSFLAFFIQTGELFKKCKWFTILLTSLTVILIILYITEITTLIVHLHSTTAYSLTEACQ